MAASDIVAESIQLRATPLFTLEREGGPTTYALLCTYPYSDGSRGAMTVVADAVTGAVTLHPGAPSEGWFIAQGWRVSVPPRSMGEAEALRLIYDGLAQFIVGLFSILE